MDAKRRLARKRLDQKIHPLRSALPLLPPPKGWVRAIRDALGMTAVTMASRLGIASQSFEDLEKSEAAGKITLDSLNKIARALDCTVVYALVPNTSLEDTINRRARQIALRDLKRVDQTMALEDQSVDTELEEQIADYIREHLSERDLWTRDVG